MIARKLKKLDRRMIMIRKINIKLLLSSLFCVLMLMFSQTNLGAVSRMPTYPKI